MRDLTQNVGNVLTIQRQTCVDEIFKCNIFVGYGGGIFFLPVFHLTVAYWKSIILYLLPHTLGSKFSLEKKKSCAQA